MDGKKRQPAFIVAVLALLGASSLPQIFKGQDDNPASITHDVGGNSPRTAVNLEEDDKDFDRRDLKPFLDFISDGRTSFPPSGGLKEYIDARLQAMCGTVEPALYCLVLAMPRPVESSASARFDEFLDVVQRAVELQGFTLDRSSLPWQPTNRGAGAPPDRSMLLRNERSGWEFKIESTTVQPPSHGRPGLIVFKSPLTNTEPSRQRRILLAFIVTETPALGINKHEMVRSLSLIDRYFYNRLTPEGPPDDDLSSQSASAVTAEKQVISANRRVVHIVAPNFDGAQWSLELALQAWIAGTANRYHVRVLSSNAGRIDPKHLEESIVDPKSKPGDRNVLTFRSMVHKSMTVLEHMLKYMTKLEYKRPEVAILIESNSGLQQAEASKIFKGEFAHNRDDRNKHATLDELGEDFIFPLQVSEIRKAYLKSAGPPPPEDRYSGSPDRLPIPPEESGIPIDLPRSFTPASSAAMDEMALTQILTTISRRPYKAIGIIASSPFDTVFLARRVRRFCPNLRIFATQADLLFARPENLGDLRGMLLASTYSLYPANQWIITSYGARPHVLFCNQASQGLYNAVVAHLWEMGVSEHVSEPQLLEFSRPYEMAARNFDPPIWISAVGERGIFPLRAQDANDSGYLYDPTINPEHRRLQTPNYDKELEGRRFQAMRPSVHLLYWLFWLVLCTLCFALTGLTLLYARWATDPDKNAPLSKLGYSGMGHLLRLLNCESRPPEPNSAEPGQAENTQPAVVGDARREPYNPQQHYADSGETCRPRLGAGIYLFLANLLLLGLTSYTFWFMLIGQKPYKVGLGIVPNLLHYLGYVAWASILASTVTSLPLAFSEVCLGRLNEGKPPCKWTLVRSAFAIAFVLAIPGLVSLVASAEATAEWRLDYERITNLPSGVSPLFPVLFLTLSLGTFVYFQLARRRMFRQSFLTSQLHADQSEHRESLSQQRLVKMREERQEIDHFIMKPIYAVRHVNPLVLSTLGVLLTLFLIRLYYRGLARSFEGLLFDRVFCAAFVAGALLVIFCTLHLLAVWTNTRALLEHTVDLPMAQAFDRVPERLKGWFFGEADFSQRKEVVIRQSAALYSRSTEELATLFNKVFPVPGKSEYWHEVLEEMKGRLKDGTGSLKATRSVYPFLNRIWDNLPVEELPRHLRSDRTASGVGPGEGNGSSWPLIPSDRPKITDVEHAILRDWVRMAEDLLALQLVRWFAPALSQLLPIMKYLVMGSLLLLLALTSYPFDHEGWMMTVMVTIIVFVAAVLAVVLIGVNRDELVSRVSDTAPGRLSFDSGFLNLSLTTIGPLVAALLAVSFDLSDLLHTWLGPIFKSM